MTQRIKLQYTVTTEELEGEVKRLLKSALHQLKSTEDIFKDTNTVFSQHVIEDIEKIRDVMISVDMRLDDIANIVSGYLSFKNSTPETSPAQQIDDLKEQLTNFKQQFSTDQKNEVAD